MSKVRKIGDLFVKHPNSFTDEEISYYLDVCWSRHKDTWSGVHEVIMTIDGEDCVCQLVYKSVPFERIRRITGYLAPTDRWNEAKRAELGDRVKHKLGGGDGKAEDEGER